MQAGMTDRKKTSRLGTLVCAGAVVSLLCCIGAAQAQSSHMNAFRMMGQQRHTLPPPPRNPQPRASHSQPPAKTTPPIAEPRTVGPAPRQEHLEEWRENHRNLTIDQQVQALQQEPGFSQLPPNTQQHMVQRLRELNAMTPEQLQQTSQHMHAMEELTPQQRQQVRGTLLQLDGLPPDRQRLIRKAFRDLREVPPEQRQSILDSDRFRTQFSHDEMGVLHNLLEVEPYLPAPRQNER
jgi:DNA-directed RNA polymerase subunit F